MPKSQCALTSVDTRRRFKVYKASIQRHRCRIDVLYTLKQRHMSTGTIKKLLKWSNTLTHFSPVLNFIKKPVIWFAQQNKWLVYIINAVLGGNRLIPSSIIFENSIDNNIIHREHISTRDQHLNENGKNKLIINIHHKIRKFWWFTKYFNTCCPKMARHTLKITLKCVWSFWDIMH